METMLGITIERNVPAVMRDGTTLYADVYRPATRGPFPVLLLRLPYDKGKAETSGYSHPLWYARQGYVVVVQDTRGRWASEGEFYPFRYEMTDGYDTVEWAARLPGSNGKVGMYGFSYPGATQLLAALMQPPSLVCICPGLTGSQYYNGWAYNGGAFSLAFNLSWAMALSTVTANHRHDPALERDLWAARHSIYTLYDYLPLRELPLLKDIAPFYYDWLAHPTYDDYWRAWSINRHYDKIQVPALHIAGWYDVFRDGTIQNFQGLRAATPHPQKLLVGPWLHSPWSQLTGKLDFGPDARHPVDDMQRQWFDYWLKGIDNGIAGESPVRVFAMGRNQWLHLEHWPPDNIQYVDYYLHSEGRANTLGGDGWLSPEKPGDEVPDVYIYDPRMPVPSFGGNSCCAPDVAPMGPTDQRKVETLTGVLVYTSEVLQEDVTVMGPVTARLWATTTAVDTDFTVKLVDVYPDGRAINIVEGIIRARHRNSLETESLLTPGDVYEFTIDVGHTCQVFQAGHRLRVEVSSSSYPHWDRNPNSGQPLGTDDYSQLRVATQIIFHDSQHPSAITLPICPA